jgi:hypothetical protein
MNKMWTRFKRLSGKMALISFRFLRGSNTAIPPKIGS